MKLRCEILPNVEEDRRASQPRNVGINANVNQHHDGQKALGRHKHTGRQGKEKHRRKSKYPDRAVDRKRSRTQVVAKKERDHEYREEWKKDDHVFLCRTSQMSHDDSWRNFVRQPET